MTSNADGDLVFTQAGSQHDGHDWCWEITCWMPITTRTGVGRYSEYRVRGHGRGGGKPGMTANPPARLAAPVGVISDRAVPSAATGRKSSSPIIQTDISRCTAACPA
ncbi:hypothetical protein [Escherichia coli]|uniref:hypothetical protein n=1 Tax=Escherichia coli TaxID=562 RepID=UPI003F5D3870